MIPYAYLRELEPPAPFVNVVLRNPVGGAELRGLPAQFDTAADRTVLPEAVVKSLNLAQVGVMNFAGLGGVICSLPTYAVLLGIHDRPARPFKVAAHAGES